MNRRSIHETKNVEFGPVTFYRTIEVMRRAASTADTVLDPIAARLDETCGRLDEYVDNLSKVDSIMLQEEKRTMKKNPFAGEMDSSEDLRENVGGDNFLRLVLIVVMNVQQSSKAMREIVNMLRPQQLFISGKFNADNLFSADYQHMQFEFDMNVGAVVKFVSGVMNAAEARLNVVKIGQGLAENLQRFCAMLERRHSVEGLLIHGDPVRTDLAMSIFDNVDASGEIEDGRGADELSAYSARKAIIMADAVKSGLIAQFVTQPEKLIEFISGSMQELWSMAQLIATFARPLYDEVRKILGRNLSSTREMSDEEFNQALDMLMDLDPNEIKYREKTTLISPEERFALNFRNETIKGVADRLADPQVTTKDLIDFILKRKVELRDYFRDENSFYVCRVGSGNPFGGQAPGALEVIPGTRPNINLDEIVGSGFDEVRGFIETVEASGKWYELFLATSPSKTSDKTNVLLIGPQGAGKSEVLRAVGGDKKSVGIFAVGSDFLTCWKGEAEKNPKRLFEAANKLQKESKKHVHLLIDEIDTILNKDGGRDSFGGTNLVTEFQNLMDGVVHYPNISVWGATNHPDRIPMPMIRRFSKVLIVGELTQENRVHLLKHFSGYMPIEKGFKSAAWEKFATALEGATGDVIRKVVDHVWRTKMTAFIRKHGADAEKVRNFLVEQSDGGRFTLAGFTPEKRAEFKKLLAESGFRPVTEADLRSSINAHLENVAIYSEIQTAKETYAKAHSFIAAVRNAEPTNGKEKKAARKVVLEAEGWTTGDKP